MKLYKNTKGRTRKLVADGLSKVAGVSVVSVRRMGKPDLYPDGPIIQFNLGPDQEFSVELNIFEATGIRHKLGEFIDARIKPARAK